MISFGIRRLNWGFLSLLFSDSCLILWGADHVIVRPKIYARSRKVIRGASLVEVSGEVQKKGIVINVIATHFKRAFWQNHSCGK